MEWPTIDTHNTPVPVRVVRGSVTAIMLSYLDAMCVFSDCGSFVDKGMRGGTNRPIFFSVTVLRISRNGLLSGI